MNTDINISITPAAIITAVILLFVTAIAWLIRLLISEQRKRKEFEEKQRALEIKVQSMEFETIKYKLNPHLFKNTLNAIQSHAYQTYYALDKLSSVLDYILYESERPFVSLREEIEFALSLIEINRLKVSPLFDLRIKNKVDVNDLLYDQKLMAPLITIDLIENAFKHADIQSADAFISIVFELKNNDFLLTVSNKISARPAMQKEKGGFGKQSLKTRLETIYKNNYSLSQFTEGDVYITHLKINLLEHKAQMLVAG